MIKFYTWSTPNGIKVAIMLEELELAYKLVPINIGAGEQFSLEFLKISPNNKIPAIIDSDGPGSQAYSLFESGAILMYLAEKYDALMPQAIATRYNVIQWLMFQMDGVGPMLGQAHHFRDYAAEKIPYAIQRYTKEAGRIYCVINTRLRESRFLAGDDYSIADIATFPWLRSHKRQGQTLEDFPHLKRWYDEISSRPAVQRGINALKDLHLSVDDNARECLFGKTQYQR